MKLLDIINRIPNSKKKSLILHIEGKPVVDFKERGSSSMYLIKEGENLEGEVPTVTLEEIIEESLNSFSTTEIELFDEEYEENLEDFQILNSKVINLRIHV